MGGSGGGDGADVGADVEDYVVGDDRAGDEAVVGGDGADDDLLACSWT